MVFYRHADRTRMRWVFEETEYEATTAIKSFKSDGANATAYYSLQGIRLIRKPASGIFIEVTTNSEGKTISRKVSAQ